MENAPYVLLALVAFGIVSLVYRRFRRGSWTGAMLGGRIVRTTGEVTLSSTRVSSQKLVVHAMAADDGENFVALTLTAKAPLAANMQPLKLTRAQALELAAHLLQAARTDDSGSR
jgi:hypothetical protein